MSAVSITDDVRPQGRRSLAALVLHQCRYDLRRLWRNPQSRFFTLAMPLLLLIVFGFVFHGADVKVSGSGDPINEAVYYVPGIIAYGLIAAVFMDLTIGLVGARESGIAKRRLATPAPAVAILAGRVAVAVMTGLIISVMLAAVGWAAFGASVPASAAPVLVIDVLVGTVAFCSLAVAAA